MDHLILTSKYFGIVEKFESVHLQAYFDAAGYLTVGIGHLVRDHEITKYLGQGLSLAEAKRLWKSNQAEFYKRVPKFTLEYVHELKRVDMEAASSAVLKRIKTWGVKPEDVPSKCFEVLTDLAFNGGPGQLDGTIASLMRKKDFTGAMLFTAMFCNARDPKDKSAKPKSVPFTGLTFRRYSVIWYGFTGEAWRIGAEGGADKDWAEVELFLKKLTEILKKEGRTNPLPYPNNRREAQKY